MPVIQVSVIGKGSGKGKVMVYQPQDCFVLGSGNAATIFYGHGTEMDAEEVWNLYRSVDMDQKTREQFKRRLRDLADYDRDFMG